MSCGPASADLHGGIEGQTATVRTAGIQEGAPLAAPPQRVAPADGQVYRVRAGAAQEIRLQWEPSRSSSARVQVANNPLFAKGIHLDKTVSGQTSCASQLKEGTYFWRLRSEGTTNQAFWSGPTRFNVLGVEGGTKTPPSWILEVDTTAVEDSVLLKGRVKPRVRVTVNDLEVSVDKDGTFLGTFPLPPRGPEGRLVTVRAFDQKGNEKTWTKSF